MFTSSFMFDYLHNFDDIFVCVTFHIFVGGALAASTIDQVDLIRVLLPADTPISVSAWSKP